MSMVEELGFTGEIVDTIRKVNMVFKIIYEGEDAESRVRREIEHERDRGSELFNELTDREQFLYTLGILIGMNLDKMEAIFKLAEFEKERMQEKEKEHEC